MISNKAQRMKAPGFIAFEWSNRQAKASTAAGPGALRRA
jgi:hypothetical protein